MFMYAKHIRNIRDTHTQKKRTRHSVQYNVKTVFHYMLHYLSTRIIYFIWVSSTQFVKF
jgi:hypothetical protein